MEAAYGAPPYGDVARILQIGNVQTVFGAPIIFLAGLLNLARKADTFAARSVAN